MALKIEDRVKETTTTSGTGDITLGGAVTGFRTFAAAQVADGDTFHYLIEAVDANGLPSGDWETGIGTKTGATTIQRTECKSSSAGGVNKVNFAGGTKLISISFTATHAKTLTSTPTSPSVLTPFGRPETYGALVFQDEFDGSSLNPAVWNDHIWYQGSDPTINFDVTNSKLRIWPQKTPGGQYVNRTIDTDGKVYFKYGFFEFHAKLCNGYGPWPAGWLLGHENGALRPEIDVMEAYPGGENAGNGGWSNSANQPLNYAGNVYGECGNPCGSRGERKMNQDGGIPFQRLDNSFHRYQCKWEPDGVTWYFDGQQLGSKVFINEQQRRLYWLFQVWFGNASGNPLSRPPGVPEVTNGPSNAFEIEYFRVWNLS